MDLLSIIIVIVVVGVCLWLVNSYIPMQPSIKKILNIFVVIVLVVWLLKEAGILHYLGQVKV